MQRHRAALASAIHIDRNSTQLQDWQSYRIPLGYPSQDTWSREKTFCRDIYLRDDYFQEMPVDLQMVGMAILL